MDATPEAHGAVLIGEGAAHWVLRLGDCTPLQGNDSAGSAGMTGTRAGDHGTVKARIL